MLEIVLQWINVNFALTRVLGILRNAAHSEISVQGKAQGKVHYFFYMYHQVSRRPYFKIWGLSDLSEKSYRDHFFIFSSLWRPLMTFEVFKM